MKTITQEDKDLLLIDLCAKWPYGVKINFWLPVGNGKYERKVGTLVGIDKRLPTDELIIKINNSFVQDCVETSKPYLRPMSSMTEEEKLQYNSTREWKYVDNDHYEWFDTIKTFDWLNANFFDYRKDEQGKSMIEKGLALKAPADMYKTD